MNVDEAIEKIKVLLSKKKAEAAPEVAADVVAEEVKTEDVPEVINPEPASERTPEEQAEYDAKAKESWDAVKEQSDKALAQLAEVEQKLSAQTEENTIIRSAMNDLVTLVKFLSEQPTEAPTEEKKDGVKNFLADKTKSSLEKYQDGFKQVNQKLNSK